MNNTSSQHQLDSTNWHGKHVLAADCTVTVSGHKDGSSWQLETNGEKTFPKGTVLDIQHATSMHAFVLLEGEEKGIAILKTELGKLVVEN
ncbi:MAG: hypothetical protein WCX61_02845 [Candidatus Peribacteraceae bacterium]|jgi:hypothetical protein